MQAPTLDAKLQFLKTPQAYGQVGEPPVCIETHMSCVFLVGEFVYKLKKPICLPFVDFRALNAREFYCREEVRLNAQLAPGVYLGLVVLQWCDPVFSLVPDDVQRKPGQTVDWLVWMRRLPSHLMLSHLIKKRALQPQDLNKLTDQLGHFFATAHPADLSQRAYLDRLAGEQSLNRDVLLQPQLKLALAPRASNRLTLATTLCQSLLCERVAGQRILQGHGDMRPDHVYLTQPPVVVDSLEFNTALRQLDPFDEITYLGLECAMYGAPWVAPYLVAGISKILREHPSDALLDFYLAHRAMLRARLAAAHLLDPQSGSTDNWRGMARRYLQRSLLASEKAISSLQSGWPG